MTETSPNGHDDDRDEAAAENPAEQSADQHETTPLPNHTVPYPEQSTPPAETPSAETPSAGTPSADRDAATGAPKYGERLPGYGTDAQPTDQYTAPYPQYGQSQYGHAQNAGADQSNGGQYDGGQYGSGQYGSGQYGQEHGGQYGSGQYGAGGQYGQEHGGQYDQGGQYGQGGAGQYGQGADPYGQHGGQSGWGHSGDQSSGAHQPAQYGHQSYEDAQYAAYGATAGSATSTARPRRNWALVVGMLVAAAIVGGLAGGGISAAVANNNAASNASSSTSGGNITVNDYNSASVVTAVAAKATDSVVTINATASNEAGTGSGVVLSKDGYIITNTHVVTLDGDSSSATISVTLANGKIYSGKIVGTDPTVDLAVVKINATGLTPIDFADSSKLNVGDTAIAIGAPLGLSNTVTDGIVSTLNRSISVASSAPGSGSGDSNQGGGSQDPFNFGGESGTSTSTTVSLPVIQTDAAINPGNSGGALLDSKGRLIGINVAIASAGSSSSSSDAQSGSIGVGFAIPANLAKRVGDEIMANGKATHGLLGATVTDATSNANATQVGALIESVSSGGAASKAGLQKGDVVTSLGGIPITDGTDLTAQVRYLAGGSKTTVTFTRGGQSKTVDVTLGTYDSNS